MNYGKLKIGKNKGIDFVVFAVLLLVYTAVTYTLFSRQVFGSEQLYHSDMKAYILEMQGLDSGYQFPYPLFFKLGALLHLGIQSPQLAVAAAVTILNSLSLIFMKYYMDQELQQYWLTKGAWKELTSRLFTTSLTFCLFFVSMLYSITGRYLPGIKRRYVGVFSPNPHHNATYLATRPFAIVCFFVFVRILKNYEKKISWRDNAVFGLFLFLTTITKPSFTFVLVPTAGLVMLYRLCRAKFKNWAPTIKLGLCFLPTFGALIYQFFGVFGPVEGEETGIGFGLGEAWQHTTDNIVLAIILGLAFPLTVLVLNWKRLKTEEQYRFGWQLTLVSLVEVLFFYEKGFRLAHMNFSWGYMHGLFFAHVSSLILLLKLTLDRKSSVGKWKKLLLLGQWMVFLWHLVCGLWYFRSVFLGDLYY